MKLNEFQIAFIREQKRRINRMPIISNAENSEEYELLIDNVK